MANQSSFYGTSAQGSPYRDLPPPYNPNTIYNKPYDISSIYGAENNNEDNSSSSGGSGNFGNAILPPQYNTQTPGREMPRTFLNPGNGKPENSDLEKSTKEWMQKEYDWEQYRAADRSLNGLKNIVIQNTRKFDANQNEGIFQDVKATSRMIDFFMASKPPRDLSEKITFKSDNGGQKTFSVEEMCAGAWDDPKLSNREKSAFISEWHKVGEPSESQKKLSKGINRAMTIFGISSLAIGGGLGVVFLANSIAAVAVGAGFLGPAMLPLGIIAGIIGVAGAVVGGAFLIKKAVNFYKGRKIYKKNSKALHDMDKMDQQQTKAHDEFGKKIKQKQIEGNKELNEIIAKEKEKKSRALDTTRQRLKEESGTPPLPVRQLINEGGPQQNPASTLLTSNRPSTFAGRENSKEKIDNELTQ